MGKPIKPRILGPRLVFPADALARLPADVPADNLLKVSVRNDDVILRLEYPLLEPPETGPSDILQLMIDNAPVGDIIELKRYKPEDIIDITLYAADRPLDAVLDQRIVGINYRVTYVSGAGQTEDGPRDQRFVTDIVRPGRDSLGPLVFAPGVETGGVTPDTLVDDGAGSSYLPCTVKGYYVAATGDWIVGWIDDTGRTATVEIVSAQVGQDIELRFPRALLEQFDGATHRFTCRITDRAGNESLASTTISLRVRLSENIDDLRPPVVPGALDGLVTDSDARTGGVAVRIPGHASIQAGDAIRLRWNTYVSTPSIVDASEVGKDPLKILFAPYGVVYDDWFATAGDTDRDIPAMVGYRVERAGSSIGEPVQPTIAPVNLFGAGGKDPTPETPEHENLHPPVVQAAGGGPPNIIPPDAIGSDATATLSGLTAGSPAETAFRAGDRVQLYWDGQAVDDEFVVASSGTDVVRRIPAAVLSAHSPGVWNVHYSVVRALATAPFVNTVLSPVQRVEVMDSSDLPGGGTLDPAKWVEGPASPGLPDQIDYDKALSGGGTPLRIYGYTNIAEGDVVAIVFQGYDSITPPGNPVPESRFVFSYTIEPGDLIPKRDDTVQPPGDAVFIDILVPTANLLPIVYGRATFDYGVTNAAGSANAEQSWIYISVRPPGA